MRISRFEHLVHEYRDTTGRLRFAVAEYDAKAGVYRRPTSASVYKRTGRRCDEYRDITNIEGWRYRWQAFREARYLYEQREGQWQSWCS